MIDATPLLRAYAHRRRAQLAAENVVERQEAQLLQLVRRATETPFGRAHDFARIRTVADFQARVPPRSYEAFWRDWWQPHFPRLANVTWPGAVPFLAVSSGTTSGASKYIPVSNAMLRANRRAALDVLVHHVSRRPESRVLGGRTFMLGGSTDLKEEAPGIFSGDLSGIAAKRTPAWARPLTFPPPAIALMRDWDAKIAACIDRAATADIRCITGTPSWLLILFDRHATAHGLPSAASALYPNLELVVHGGINFMPYRDRFEAFLAGSHAELREVYPASEGFIAIADEGPADGLRLIVDNGLFFEFVPVEELDAPTPRRFWIDNIESDVNYAILLTSCAGLWAYILGDTVRFLSRRPPRLAVTGRTSYMMSAFGEHLIGEEIEDAVATAAHAITADVSDFAMGAIFPERTGDLGHHLIFVEFATPTDAARVTAFAEVFDARLAELNDDYRAHRAEGFGMGPPRVHVVAPGFFADWMEARGRLGGQNKVPRVINDPQLFAELRAFAER
ncbi:MAG: GH3 auxin-responsive promoter family protein [Dongiaceae bacterium]